MKVKCYNKKCFHIWDYRGENKKFICCPKCRYKRMLSKCKEFSLKEHTKKNIPNDRPNDIQGNIPHSKEYMRVVEKKQTDFVVKDAKPISRILEGVTKVCKIHKLPARYDDLEKKWACVKCHDVEIPKEKVFNNLSDFNMEVLERRFENGELESKEREKEIPVIVSHGLQGSEIRMKKYHPLISNLGQVREILNNQTMKVIPIKPQNRRENYF